VHSSKASITPLSPIKYARFDPRKRLAAFALPVLLLCGCLAMLLSGVQGGMVLVTGGEARITSKEENNYEPMNVGVVYG